MSFVGEPIRQHAQRRPSGSALLFEGREYSWSELDQEITFRASSLAHFPKASRLALSLRRQSDLLTTFLAIIRAGHIAMVYDPDWPQERRQLIENATSPAVVLDEATKWSRDCGTALIAPDEQSSFYIGFTSGSTGLPKGFERSHRSWLKSFSVSEEEFGINPHDHVLIVGSLQHSLHLYGAVHALHVGACVSLAHRFEPKPLANLLADGHISVLYATPTQLHYLHEILERQNKTARVKMVLASGAKWQADDRRKMAVTFPMAHLAEFYGASETSFLTILQPAENAPDGSVGRPANGVRIKIGDPGEAELAPGEVGRIWVKSDLLFSGYVCGGSKDTSWSNGWLTVGDQGYVDENGFLHLRGRESRMIISSGLNIYPEEIERVLLAVDGVGDAAVFGLEDGVRGQRLVAAIRVLDESALSSEQLYQRCVEQLGRSFAPKAFFFERDWPLTQGGKTDLVALRAKIERLAGE